MRIPFLPAAGLAALLLAPVGAHAVPAPQHKRPVNAYSEQLKRLSPLQQRSTLRRAVLDERQYCRRIGPVTYQGPYKNLEMWTVQCDAGAAYGVFIGQDGSVQARPCRDMASLKLPACRLPRAKK